MATKKVDDQLVERVARELSDAEAALAAATAQHEQALAESAADLEVGALSIGDAAARTDASAQTLARAQTLVDRLGRALPELVQRLDAQQAAGAEKAALLQAEKLTDACRTANKAAAELGALLVQAEKLAGALVILRASAEGVPDKAGAPRGGQRSVPPFSRSAPSRGTGRKSVVVPTQGWVDEPDFTAGLASLKLVLDGGPRRPLADQKAGEQQRQEEQARQHEEILDWVRVRPAERAPRIIARGDLPDGVKEAARQILAEARAARERADGVHDAEPVLLTVSGKAEAEEVTA